MRIVLGRRRGGACLVSSSWAPSFTELASAREETSVYGDGSPGRCSPSREPGQVSTIGTTQPGSDWRYDPDYPRFAVAGSKHHPARTSWVKRFILPELLGTGLPGVRPGPGIHCATPRALPQLLDHAAWPGGCSRALQWRHGGGPFVSITGRVRRIVF